ncbi:dehydratase [Sphingomonas sp. CGMCC 1.13654]|uniref:Dehydratase n=1 Tax=Sphingomonas chungangi TaxID=2683589 RepID=A0A838L5R3_9SPHN|nr:MaoC/PaaZ C-terminal domain-containing protein [Sphingomonas chungangi]MBA2933526.1 dehydratase [Sphingomonas chungangi]MVW54859.1 dehydratase [Sphingomonas chungangi]
MADLLTETRVAVGDRLPDHVLPPISRTTLALFAGASHDHVPLHIDSDFARAAGMEDVFAHGMLSMAYLAQMLTRWAPQERLRRWSARFTAITPLHAAVTCRGEVVEIFEEAGEWRARVKIGSWTDKDVQTLDGEAVVALA